MPPHVPDSTPAPSGNTRWPHRYFLHVRLQSPNCSTHLASCPDSWPGIERLVEDTPAPLCFSAGSGKRYPTRTAHPLRQDLAFPLTENKPRLVLDNHNHKTLIQTKGSSGQIRKFQPRPGKEAPAPLAPPEFSGSGACLPVYASLARFPDRPYICPPVDRGEKRWEAPYPDAGRKASRITSCKPQRYPLTR